VRRGGPFLFPVAAVVLAVLGGQACSKAATPGGDGASCEVATDCAEGYACIAQPNGTRACSSNLSSIQQTEEAGMEAAATPDEGGTTGDATTPPASDAGNPAPEAGTPPKDSGTPAKEAGSPPKDSGTPPQDSAPPQDAEADDAAGE
jgi:hypothetical protein